MTDTPPEIEKLYFDMLMKKSNEERFLMGARMFEAAKEIVIASFPEGLSKSEFRERLFLRFYGSDFKKEEKEKILEHIRKHS
jgi:hypothetical protein